MVRVYPWKPPQPAPPPLFHLSVALLIGEGVQAPQHLDRPRLQPALLEAAAQVGCSGTQHRVLPRRRPGWELCSQACPQPGRIHPLFMPFTFVTK